jgi:hypothetical protein
MTYKKVPFNNLNGVNWEPNDLNKKFSFSYVVASAQDKVDNELVFITTAALVTGSSVHTYFWHKNNKTSKLEEATTKLNQFHVLEDRPDPCITNLENSAYMMVYNPERQWRRGFGIQNCFLLGPQFTNMNTAMRTNIGGGTNWRWDVAEAVLNPKHQSIDAALDDIITNPKISARAINNRYWLIKSGTDEIVKLYRRQCFIGSFLGKRFFYNEDARILRQELKDEFPQLVKKYAA